MAQVQCLLQKLWISESSLSTPENFKCQWDLLNMKCNCTVLFFKINVLCMLPNILSHRPPLQNPNRNFLISSKKFEFPELTVG